jgi:hypothetical protein
VGGNVRLNAYQAWPGPYGRSETTIAADAGGAKLVAGWNDAEGFLRPPFAAGAGTPGLSGFGWSRDGGRTWVDAGAPPVWDGIVTRGDPWLDAGGPTGDTFFFANLAVNLATGDSIGVSVHRGTFAGDGFAFHDVVVLDSPRNAARPGADFYDKEAIAAGKAGSRTAVVTVTNFQELCGQAQYGFGQIEAWRTHDGGATWEGPAVVGPEAPDSVASCGETGTLQQSSVPAIGPGGEVYVAWQHGPTFTPAASTAAAIVVARSLDGGATFEPFVKVADIHSMRQNPPVGYSRPRLNDHPRIAVAQDGTWRGRVYVAFTSAASPATSAPLAQSVVSSDVYIAWSDDGGRTFGAPVRVAEAVPASGLKRFWPVVTVEPGGSVDVVFLESAETPTPGNAADWCYAYLGRDEDGNPLYRAGPAHSRVSTMWARSTDGGARFGAPARASSGTSDWCTTWSNIVPNYGDYIGSASTASGLFPAWADGSTPYFTSGWSVADVFTAAIRTAGRAP